MVIDSLDECRWKSWNNTIESVGGGIVKIRESLHSDAQLGGSQNVGHILLILCEPFFVLHVLCFILYVLEQWCFVGVFMFIMIDLNRNKNLEPKENVMKLYCAVMMGDDSHGLL
jgi:hypothetical protein